MHPARNSLGASLVRGALLWSALGAAAFVLLVAEAVTHGATSDVLVALGLLACFAVGGVAGALVHSRTAALRERGSAGFAWALVGGAAALTTMLAARLLARTAAIPEMEAGRIAVVTDWPAIVRLTVAATLFGVLWARTAMSRERTAVIAGLTDDVGNGVLLFYLAMPAIASFAFLFESKHIPLPETPEDARKVIVAAEREAHARPRDAQSQMVLAVSFMRLGRLDDAIPAFERVVQLTPENAYAHDALGWALNRERKYAEAVPHLEEALRLDARYADALHNLGVSNLGLKHYQAAEVVLREAVRLDSHKPSLAADYADALYERGQVRLALQYIQRASRMAPDEVRYHGIAGMLLRDQGRFAEATAQFGEIIRLDPHSFGGWVDIGITQYLAGNASAAVDAFTEGKRLDPQAFEQHQMAQAMLRDALQGRTDRVHVRLRGSAAPDSIRTAGR
ncbi:MAG: tetratricopeptide repeat protein [Gemmatimonadetes bacterium]|nr:tetratricopeptide repeat protein [Gemmatimonadota bacterium]